MRALHGEEEVEDVIWIKLSDFTASVEMENEKKIKLFVIASILLFFYFIVTPLVFGKRTQNKIILSS